MDGHSLSPAAVAAVARGDERVAIAPDGYDRVRRDRAVVDDAVSRRLPVYGVTTGLGARAGFTLQCIE